MPLKLHSHVIFQLIAIIPPPPVHIVFVLQAIDNKDDRYLTIAYDTPEQVVIDTNDISQACASDAVNQKAYATSTVSACS
jgi:hypothetical protein